MTGTRTGQDGKKYRFIAIQEVRVVRLTDVGSEGGIECAAQGGVVHIFVNFARGYAPRIGDLLWVQVEQVEREEIS